MNSVKRRELSMDMIMLALDRYEGVLHVCWKVVAFVDIIIVVLLVGVLSTTLRPYSYDRTNMALSFLLFIIAYTLTGIGFALTALIENIEDNRKKEGVFD